MNYREIGDGQRGFIGSPFLIGRMDAFHEFESACSRESKVLPPSYKWSGGSGRGHGGAFFMVPLPLSQFGGGARLFWILVGVDVVCGPLLTLVIFNPKKSRRELFLDYSFVILLQVAALVYGVYSISLARPTLMAFEVDRFVAVTAAQIEEKDLKKALPQFRTQSWSGPEIVGVRNPKNSEEMLASLQLSLNGLEPSLRPDWWIPYDACREDVKKKMKSISVLRKKPGSRAAISKAMHETGLAENNIYYLPLVYGKNLDGWVVLLNGKADVVGYLPVDGF